MSLFQKKPKPQPVVKPPPKPIVYPSGAIVHAGDEYYYVKGGTVARFVSERAALSWGLPIAEAWEINITNYQIKGVLGFRDLSLIQNIADGKLYLVSEGKKRHVVDPDILTWL